MTGGMLPYILFVLVMYLGVVFQNIKNLYINKIGQIFILFVFFGVAGLSYKIHNDYFVYENVYYWVNKENIEFLRFEIGYKYLNYIFNKYLTFYQFKAMIYFFNTILIYLGLRKIVSKKETYLTIAFLYIGFSQFYRVYFSAFRQSIAIAIFIYSLSYLKERKFWRYMCLIVIATLFHESAILLVPVYFFYNIKIKQKMSKIIVTYIIFSILSFNNSVINFIKELAIKIISLLNYTINSDYLDTLSYTGYIYTIFILMTLILDYMIEDPLLERKKGDFIYMSLFLFIIINFLGKLLAIFFRIEIYFYIFYFIFFIRLLNRLNKEICFFLLKIVFIFLLILNYNLKYIYVDYKERGGYIPFLTLLDENLKEINYQETAEYAQAHSLYSRDTTLKEMKERIKKIYFSKE